MMLDIVDSMVGQCAKRTSFADCPRDDHYRLVDLRVHVFDLFSGVACGFPRISLRVPLKMFLRMVRLVETDEQHVGPLRTFAMGNANHPNHPVLARALQDYLRWRTTHACHPSVLQAQRCGRARVPSERQQRWGRPRPQAA